MADLDIQRGAQLFRRTMTERLGDSEKGKMLAQMLLPSFPVDAADKHLVQATWKPWFKTTLTLDGMTLPKLQRKVS
jgi:hypothetical protein